MTQSQENMCWSRCRFCDYVKENDVELKNVHHVEAERSPNGYQMLWGDEGEGRWGEIGQWGQSYKQIERNKCWCSIVQQGDDS